MEKPQTCNLKMSVRFASLPPSIKDLHQVVPGTKLSGRLWKPIHAGAEPAYLTKNSIIMGM
jgi:hypothetical protein